MRPAPPPQYEQPTFHGWVAAFSGAFPSGSVGRESACSAGDPGLIPRSGRPLEKEMATHSGTLAGGFHGQRSGTGHGIAESDTTVGLTSLFHFTVFSNLPDPSGQPVR